MSGTDITAPPASADGHQPAAHHQPAADHQPAHLVGTDTVESRYYDFRSFDVENARTVLSYYTDFFPRGPVLELACGPGVFLGLLAEKGVAATGVDMDEGMVAQARAAGHDVVLADATDYLEKLPASSVVGVFAAHFLEHLPSEAVDRLYREAARVLVPGGRFVAVVPNPACLSVLGTDFWRDPTHVRFYDPVALEFFAEQAGLVIDASGGNPRNHPGAPAPLHTITSEPPGSLADSAVELVQHANTLLGRADDPAPEPDPDALIPAAAVDTSALWGELGHLITVLDQRVQDLRHELGAMQDAYGRLLEQLYPPNEVYVVARRSEAETPVAASVGISS